MTILLEGKSLVFANEVLDNQYPGGTLGFRSTWDNGSFCTDGTISRISFSRLTMLSGTGELDVREWRSSIR